MKRCSLHICEEEEKEKSPITKKLKPQPQDPNQDIIIPKTSISAFETQRTTTITTQEEEEVEEEEEKEKDVEDDAFDENLLYEVLKHVDERTLGRAACVSRLWHKTAQDERLWELICTRHWANMGCANQQLRSVVLALGGFRRLHSQYLLPLSKPQSSSASSAGASAPRSLPWIKAPGIGSKPTPSAKWGKDEVHLSLSLLSIRYYEKMNFCNRNR